MTNSPFRDFKTSPEIIQLAAMSSSVCNRFNHQKSIESRAKFKELKNATLLEWRELTAA